MMEMVRVCRVDEVVEGEPQLVETDDGLSLTVFAAQGGVYVTDAMCTHGMAALSDGYQEGFVIECPLHGGSFDIRSGAPLTAPCEIALKTYPATVEDGWVTIPSGGGEA